MDIKLLFYIVAAILYFFYTAYKGKNKKGSESAVEPAPSPKKNWEDELRDILQRTIQPEQPVVTAPPAPVQKPKQTFLDEEMTDYRRLQELEKKARREQEAYSVEYDTKPLADHISKDMLVAMPAHQKEPSVGALIMEEGFDARKAFLYSEIFARKY